MSIYLARNGKMLTRLNGTRYFGSVITPTPPPPLGEYTIRLLYKPNVVPNFYKGTAVQLSSNPNVWDLTYENSDWNHLLCERSEYNQIIRNDILLEVLEAETSGVTSMYGLFNFCTSLRNVALFDTSNVTSMQDMFMDCWSITSVPLFNTSKVYYMIGMFLRSGIVSIPDFDTSRVEDMRTMFRYCSSLTTVPLLNTSKVENVKDMFEDCVNVESGALALYQQLSSQRTPPSTYSGAFKNCGSNTQTGAAELAQIPDDWK